MSRLFLLFFSLSISVLYSQNTNLELISRFNPEEAANDIWGFVDHNDVEYAVMGTQSHTLVISLEDPENPNLILEVEGASTTWRDIKSYEDHLYVIGDGINDGLLIIDMSNPRDTITYEFYKPEIMRDDQIHVLGGCHNLYIDPETGLLFLSGCNQGTNGIIIMDLKVDKKKPELTGLETLEYSHDVFAKGDRMYTSEIYRGQLGIYDISDPSSPELLATQPTSSSFTHNAWTSDDQRFVFTTDEEPNATIDAYDISDLDFIEQVDRFKPLKTANRGVIPHNTHYLNGFLITSWYTDGVIITDVHRPHNMIEVGNYDTWSGADGGFSGCWGAYPFLPSGMILASDRSTGLYVLRPNYVQACYLEGQVTNIQDGMPINNVKIELIDGSAPAEFTNAVGDFATGQLQSGTFQLLVSHPAYVPQELEVTLSNGELSFVNIQMVPRKRVQISGKILNKLTGEAIESAVVTVQNKDLDFPLITDENGLFTQEVFEGTYNIYAGKWGYTNEGIVNQEIKSNNNFTIEIEPGYQDDFALDLGWQESGDASTGNWVIAEPIPTYLADLASNPGTDIDNDLGTTCYVTGNGEGSVGDHDVDGGETILTSPVMDLSDYQDPIIEYDLWFFNSGGGSTPNDSVLVRLTNGQDTIILENLKDPSRQEGFWRERRSFPIAGLIDLTDNMKISFQANDGNPGHISEAAIDAFHVVEGMPNATDDDILLDHTKMSLYPNPVSDILNISFGDSSLPSGHLFIHNVQGKEIEKEEIHGTHMSIELQIPDGMYFVQFVRDQRVVETKKFVKITR